jgi:hypothetical protein
MTRAEKIKGDIDQAVENREARVVILISNSIRNALDMLDEQPAVVIEAMLRHGKDLHVSGSAPKHSKDQLYASKLRQGRAPSSAKNKQRWASGPFRKRAHTARVRLDSNTSLATRLCTNKAPLGTVAQ